MKMKSLYFLGLLILYCWNIKTTDSAGCPAKLDLVFMVDSSGSIGTSNWEILTDFLVLVVDRFDIGPDAVRVAVVQFADTATVQWKLDSPETTSKSVLNMFLKNISYTHGNTNTPSALHVVENQVLDKTGDRTDVPNLVVVVTDGKSNENIGYLNLYAANLKNMSRVIAIGVTKDIIKEELDIIASNKCEWYTVDEFTQMDNDMDKTMDLICGCMPGQYQNSYCECKNCAINTYQPQWANISCLPCAHGRTTLGTGSSQCIGNTGLIAGLVTVALLLIIVGVVLFVFFFVIRRRRNDSGASGEDFKIPPKDPAHVYNIPEETGPRAYGKPTLMHDNFGDLKSSQLKDIISDKWDKQNLGNPL